MRSIIYYNNVSVPGFGGSVRKFALLVACVAAFSLYAQNDAGESLYNDGTALVREKKYQEAIDRWRQIRSDSSFYENAQTSIARAQKLMDDERRKVPPGMRDNVLKPILFWSAVGVGAGGAALNVLGFIDARASEGTRAAYSAITNIGSPEYDTAWRAHADMVYTANLKYIAGYACYTVAAGLLTWWIFTPEFVPEVKVSFVPGKDEFAFAFEYRF